METFFGIFQLPEVPREHNSDKKPFFGPAARLTKRERDAAVLGGKLPPEAGYDPREEQPMRFVNLLSPPYL